MRLTDCPRLLLALPEFPHDPASGAARTVTTIGELMARTGFMVEVVATTSTDGQSGTIERNLKTLEVTREAGVLRYRKRGVDYSILDTRNAPIETYERRYDSLFDMALVQFRPHIIFTYGGSPGDVARQRRASAAGARVVFGLYNTRYLKRNILDHVAAVVTPSDFLSRFYRDAVGLRSTPLLTPLLPEDVLCDQVQPSSLTIVNPTTDKGLVLFLSLVASLTNKGLKIPIDVYPSRGSLTHLLRVALVCGIDFAAHPNLTIHPTAVIPSEIYRRARVLIVPSLVDDAAPRVIAEALVNGVPPVGSDRGGIPEMCADGGYVLSVPRSLGPRNLEPVSSEVLAPWVELVAAMFEGQDVWCAASARARVAGEKYLPPSVVESYRKFFEQLLGSGLKGGG